MDSSWSVYQSDDTGKFKLSSDPDLKPASSVVFPNNLTQKVGYLLWVSIF